MRLTVCVCVCSFSFPSILVAAFIPFVSVCVFFLSGACTFGSTVYFFFCFLFDSLVFQLWSFHMFYSEPQQHNAHHIHYCCFGICDADYWFRMVIYSMILFEFYSIDDCHIFPILILPKFVGSKQWKKKTLFSFALVWTATKSKGEPLEPLGKSSFNIAKAEANKTINPELCELTPVFSACSYACYFIVNELHSERRSLRRNLRRNQFFMWNCSVRGKKNSNKPRA